MRCRGCERLRTPELHELHAIGKFVVACGCVHRLSYDAGGQLGTDILVTTAEAPKGKAASYLKMGDSRHVPKTVERLNATAQSSRNKANKHGYAAFRSLSLDQRNKLFASVWLIDAAPLIKDLERILREEVFYAVKKPFLDSFLQRLEGWWLRRTIKHLTDSASD